MSYSVAKMGILKKIKSYEYQVTATKKYSKYAVH